MVASTLTSSENVMHYLNTEAANAVANPPKHAELSAAPLADWIILLCIVWLRRVARAVERKRRYGVQ